MTYILGRTSYLHNMYKNFLKNTKHWFCVMLFCIFLSGCSTGVSSDIWWTEKWEPINTSGFVSYNVSKLDQASQGKPWDEINGYIVNQFWINSTTLDTTTLVRIIEQYPKLQLRATRDGGRVMIEVQNEKDSETLSQLNWIKSYTGISSIYNRQVIGEKAASGFYFSDQKQ